MKKWLLWGGLGLLAIVGLVYLFMGKPNTANARLVPANASMVVSFNVKSLFQKADMKKVRKMSFMERLMREMEEENKEMKTLVDNAFENPGNTGVEFASNGYFFMTAGENMREMKVGFTMALDNAGKFESFVNKILESNKDKTDKKPEIKKEGKYSYMKMDADGSGVLVWNGDAFMLIGGRGDDNLKIADNLFSGAKDDERLISNKHFKTFTESGKDMGMMLNGTQLYKFMSGVMSMGMGMGMHDMDSNGMDPQAQLEMMKKYYNGMYMQMTLNFEDDKVALVSDIDYDDDKMDQEMKAIYNKKMDPSMVNAVTPAHVLAFLGMTMDMPKIWEMMAQYKGYDQALDMIAGKVGLDKTTLKTLLRGDFTAALIDFKYLTRTHMEYDWSAEPTSLEEGGEGMPPMKTVTSEELMPIFTFTAGVKNKADLEKVLDKAAVKNGNMYVLNAPSGYRFFGVAGKAGLTVTNDSTVAAELAKTGAFSAKPREEVAKMMADEGFSMYVDMDPNNLPATTKGNIVRSMSERGYSRMTEALAPFKSITGKGSFPKGEFNLNLKGGKGNSLYTLLNHIDEQTKR